MLPSPADHVLVVDAIGVRVGIDVSALSPASRASVAAAWNDARSSAGSLADTTVVACGTVDRGQMLSDLSGAVTQAAISARRGVLLMLHAAGLAAPDGRVTVLVGPSGAGKTTATRTLARRRGYVTDETVGVDADGTVFAYRKPLSVITEGHRFKVQLSPSELGLAPLPEAPLRVGRFVLLDRRPAPAPARLVPVDETEALTALAPHCSALAVLPGPLRLLARLLAATGGAVRAEYSEARDLADLWDEMDAAEPALPAGDALDGVSSPERPSTRDALSIPGEGGAPGPRYRRADAADWLPLADDRLAVLTAAPDGGGTLRVLAGLAPLLWHCAPGAARDDLVRAIVDEIGDPSAEAGVSGILDELVEAGLLELSR